MIAILNHAIGAITINHVEIQLIKRSMNV